MGYGFIQFKKAADANEAIKTMQNFNLDGHNLELKFSTKTKQQVTASNKQKQSKQSDLREKSSKIMVRNIPFEAKTREVQELFQVFGELKYVRLPKKIDGTHRGFGFVDFVTINDAQVGYFITHASCSPNCVFCFKESIRRTECKYSLVRTSSSIRMGRA